MWNWIVQRVAIEYFGGFECDDQRGPVIVKM